MEGMQTNRGQELPPLGFPRSIRGLLEGKVAIVTGASRGIGAAAALAFVQAGAKVVLAARDAVALDGVASKACAVAEDAAFAVPTDVTDPASVQRLVALAVERLGRLDVAFNNAGAGHNPAPLAEMTLEDYDRAVGASARGTFLCMKYEIPAMLRTGGGAIVNMSSTAGLQGVNGIAGYVAGKHAVVGLTRAAAMDYARQNVRVNAVAPGPIFTERLAAASVREQASFGVPMGRVGGREEVAGVVAWLCSDLASFVTGAVVPVDGGRLGGMAFSRPAVPPVATGASKG